MRRLSAFLLAGLLMSGPAHAQDAGEQAIALGVEALAHYEQGDWGTAYELFAQAEAHYHSPVFLLHMARCRRSEGAFLEARRIFQRIVDETFDEEAPTQFHSAKRDAAAELKALLERIPRVEVVADDSTAVGVDDHRGLSNQVFEVDPGKHVVWAERGSTRRDRVVDMSAGQLRRVILELPPPPSPPPPIDPDPLADWRLPLLVSGGVVTTLGVGSLVAGTITGALALRDEARAEELCPDLECQGSGLAVVERGRKYATASEVTFAVGGALTVAGVVMIVLPFVLSPATGDSELTFDPAHGLRWRF
ncbi:MAG: hypothetical protein KC731_32845 [Myxococcales bacterium]|nr:hypothetical protein [Myxococcales bacterium]